jgi:hypothetical protein
MAVVLGDQFSGCGGHCFSNIVGGHSKAGAFRFEGCRMKTRLRKSPWIKERVNWRRFIKRLKPHVKFNAPATARQIEAAERKLGVRFPSDLYNLLLETNGVEDWLLSAEQIAEVNLEHRTDPVYSEMYTPLNGLLFFLGDGTGSYFAFPICGGKCDEVPILWYWLHENDERSFAGQTLVNVIQRYLGVSMESVKWPAMKKIECVSERVATAADLKKGRAAFVLNPAGKPKPIETVPQYAFKVDYATGEHTPVILIQAEEIGGQRLFGVRFLNSKRVTVCNRNELSLRGSTIN